uniref:Uncharacterized protein n=1 Tax=viral metagenome TaxID=1070528 RepID=A0A6M3IM85_9ZZZZ
MTDITSTCSFVERGQQLSWKEIVVVTPATADAADTITLTLSNYGARYFAHINGVAHTTENSVIVQEDPTTAVSSGVLTITIGGSATNKKRIYRVLLQSY